MHESGGLVQILAEEHVNTCGRDFTQVVFNYLANEFRKKTRIDIQDDARYVYKNFKERGYHESIFLRR